MPADEMEKREAARIKKRLEGALWRAANPDYFKDWYKRNPESQRNRRARVKKETPWRRHCEYAKRRCIDPSNVRYYCYGARGIKFELTDEQAQMLWVRDNGWDLREPSIDRINNNGHYTVDNVRFIERWQNTPTPTKVFRISSDGSRQLFPSLKSAMIALGKNATGGNIIHACDGKYKQAYGYTWEYAE